MASIPNASANTRVEKSGRCVSGPNRWTSPEPKNLLAARERYEPARGEVRVPRLRSTELTAARAPGISRPERPPTPPSATLPTAGSGAAALRGSPDQARESAFTPRAAAPVARSRLAEVRSLPAGPESNLPARSERTPELAAQGAPEPRPTAPRVAIERPAIAPESGTARGTDAPARRSQASTPAVPARPVTPRPESRATYTWTRPANPVPQAPAAAPQPSPVVQPRPAPAPAPAPTTRPAPTAPAPQSRSQNVIVIRPSAPPGFNAPAAHPWGRGGDSSSRYRVFSSPPARQVSPAQAPAPSPAPGGVPAPALTPPSRPMAPPPAFQRPSPAPAPAAPPAVTAPSQAPSFRPAPATPPTPAPSAPGRGAAAPGRSRSER
ncbi:MAG: hypothetical protein KatS3mg132_270 [Limisphaera sp.]|nr:MAG: hypothetical protein KatS3mg132_270 [Limisphaera sp.]